MYVLPASYHGHKQEKIRYSSNGSNGSNGNGNEKDHRLLHGKAQDTLEVERCGSIVEVDVVVVVVIVMED
jgi:hypothetical protein